MRETQASSMQEDSSQRLQKAPSGADLRRSTIESIADEGMPGGRKVGSNLVGAPGARLGFDQRKVSHAQQRPPIRPRSAAGREARGHARAAPGVARNGTFDLSRIPSQAAVNQGNVRLAYGARPELLAENAMSGVIARD